MAPSALFFPFLVLLFSLFTQLHYANGDPETFDLGDLGQYTTNGVRLLLFVCKLKSSQKSF
jgi:hypothetical protein